MAQKIYGIDFGTDTIKIYKKGQGIILIEKNVVSYSGEDAADAIPQSSSTIDDAAADGEGTLPEDTDADGDYVGMDEHEGDYLSEDDY